MTCSTILSANNVSKRYRQGSAEVCVLENISFNLNAQEIVAIRGASGSGKSTLLHLLGGLDQPTSGTIQWLDQDIAMLNDTDKSRLRNKQLGFVYQFHHLLPEFTALENVALPLLIRHTPKKIAQAQAAEIIAQVGLSHRLQHTTSELSGGERQRIAIARALVTRPTCLLADEPTGNLDQMNAQAVLELMLELNTIYQTALVIVTHDLAIATKIKKTYHLVDGCFVSS